MIDFRLHMGKAILSDIQFWIPAAVLVIGIVLLAAVR
jgi:hypothetical protein